MWELSSLVQWWFCGIVVVGTVVGLWAMVSLEGQD